MFLENGWIIGDGGDDGIRPIPCRTVSVAQSGIGSVVGSVALGGVNGSTEVGGVSGTTSVGGVSGSASTGGVSISQCEE